MLKNKIFSIIFNNSNHIIINFLGIKIKLKKKTQENNFEEIKKELFYIKKSLLYEKFKKHNIENAKVIVCSNRYNNLEFTYPDKKFLLLKDKDNFSQMPDAAIIWGEQPLAQNLKLVDYAFELNIPLYIAENGFLRSAYCWADSKVNNHLSDGLSFIIDKVQYFDATEENRLEALLNNPNFVLNNEQIERAQKCMNKITSNYLTKYNHQPILKPSIGRESERERVLVIDQSYRDMSIIKGLANDKTFEIMLEKAINENPDADIIVKTHPDIIQGSRKGYYQHLKEKDNLYVLTTPINPISLINYCDKVYVCSSQFGFEALMCGKEVHVFGMPFYANWGLTIDYQTCKRRKMKRSLEEIFYAAYIENTIYVNPQKKQPCEIEEAIDILLELRKEYFEKYT